VFFDQIRQVRQLLSRGVAAALPTLTQPKNVASAMRSLLQRRAA
jgi:hypothetical protein